MSAPGKCALCKRPWASDDPCACRRVAERLESVTQLHLFAALVRAGMTAEQASSVMRAPTVEA